MPNITRIALTFDDGPMQFGAVERKTKTTDLLAKLKNKSVLATFFVVGRNLQTAEYKTLYRETLKKTPTNNVLDIVSEWPAYLPDGNLSEKRIADNCGALKETIEAGHLIGNHSMTHPWRSDRTDGLLKLDDEDIRMELKTSQRAIMDATPYRVRPRFFRAPEGVCYAPKRLGLNVVIHAYNHELGFSWASDNTGYHVDWDRTSGDDQSYKSNTTSSDIADLYCAVFNSAGKILLSHDSTSALKIVEGVADALTDIEYDAKQDIHIYNKRRRIKFVTIDEYFGLNSRLSNPDSDPSSRGFNHLPRLLKGQRLRSDNRMYELVFGDDDFYVEDRKNRGHVKEYRKTIERKLESGKAKVATYGAVTGLSISNGNLVLRTGSEDVVWKSGVTDIKIEDDGKVSFVASGGKTGELKDEL